MKREKGFLLVEIAIVLSVVITFFVVVSQSVKNIIVEQVAAEELIKASNYACSYLELFRKGKILEGFDGSAYTQKIYKEKISSVGNWQPALTASIEKELKKKFNYITIVLTWNNRKNNKKCHYKLISG